MTTETATDPRTQFPTIVCTRCYGEGRYSFNQIDGDVCYGCSGKRYQIAKSACGIVDAYRALIKNGKRPLWSDVQPGDRVARDGKWAEVASTEQTDLAYRMVVTYTDGQTENVMPYAYARRQFVDRDGIYELLVDLAWAGLSKRDRAIVIGA